MTSTLTVRIGAEPDTCDECKGAIAAHGFVILYADESGTPAAMLCCEACRVKYAARAAA